MAGFLTFDRHTRHCVVIFTPFHFLLLRSSSACGLREYSSSGTSEQPHRVFECVFCTLIQVLGHLRNEDFRGWTSGREQLVRNKTLNFGIMARTVTRIARSLSTTRISVGALLSPGQTAHDSQWKLMIVDDSWSARARLTTNYHALSSTIIKYHSLWACSNSSW